jgi:hypothetical protein
MRLTARVMMTTSGLVLLTAVALGSLAYRRVDAPILMIGLAAVTSILVLAVLLAHLLMRPLVRMTAAVQAFPRDATALAPIRQPERSVSLPARSREWWRKLVINPSR